MFVSVGLVYFGEDLACGCVVWDSGCVVEFLSGLFCVGRGGGFFVRSSFGWVGFFMLLCVTGFLLGLWMFVARVWLFSFLWFVVCFLVVLFSLVGLVSVSFCLGFFGFWLVVGYGFCVGCFGRFFGFVVGRRVVRAVLLLLVCSCFSVFCVRLVVGFLLVCAG